MNWILFSKSMTFWHFLKAGWHQTDVIWFVACYHISTYFTWVSFLLNIRTWHFDVGISRSGGWPWRQYRRETNWAKVGPNPACIFTMLGESINLNSKPIDLIEIWKQTIEGTRQKACLENISHMMHNIDSTICFQTRYDHTWHPLSHPRIVWFASASRETLQYYHVATCVRYPNGINLQVAVVVGLNLSELFHVFFNLSSE